MTGEDTDPTEAALDLVDYPDQLRGGAVAAAIRTGIVEHLADRPARPPDVADALDLDPDATARLLRGLAVYGVVAADGEGRYELTPVGERFSADHEESIRDMVRFLHHPDRFAAVRHFPEVVADGEGTAYHREFGESMFDHCERDPDFAAAFNGFQDVSSSLGTTERMVEAFEAVDLSRFSTVCDVGGGYGALAAHLLDAHPHLKGTVLELPSVVAEEDRLWGPKLGVADRMTYVAGDMFESVPTADAYVLKAILHDWPDDDCVEILATVREAAPADAHLFVRERLIDDEAPTAESVDMDLWMLLETGGRERTRAEYESLFERAGWRLEDVVDVDEAVSIMDCTVAG